MDTNLRSKESQLEQRKIKKEKRQWGLGALCCVFLAFSILISSLLCQTKVVELMAERSYFNSQTFMNTLVDLTSYLKQRDIEGKELYYKKYQHIDNLIYYITKDDPKGTKAIFTNVPDQLKDKEMEELKNDSRFYFIVHFSDSGHFRIEDSLGYQSAASRYFNRAFLEMISKAQKEHIKHEPNFDNIDVYYFILNQDYVSQTDFIYTNIQEYKKTARLKLILFVHMATLALFSLIILLGAIKKWWKGSSWQWMEKICIEIKIAAAIYIYAHIHELIWRFRQPYALIRILRGSGLRKLYWLSIFIGGSLLLMYLEACYINDAISLVRRGLLKSIREQSIISKYHQTVKSWGKKAAACIYRIIGVDIRKAYHVKLIIFNIIHIGMLIFLILVAWESNEEAVVLGIIYDLMLLALLVGIVLDHYHLLQQLKKIQGGEDNRGIGGVIFRKLIFLAIYALGLIILAFVGYESIEFGFIVAIVFGFGIMVWSLLRCRALTKLYDYAASVGADQKAVKPAISFFSPIIDELSKVEEGFREAASQELVSQRMKTELISNVSHDLKTPLTSIINYVDLLKKEELHNETAENYIGILDQKSQRLKILIEDLFEASKAASGSMSLVKETIDVTALIKQTLGEMTEKISASGLQFKVNMPEERICCQLDGRRTYRIFENLLSNILKYAAPGSRVYIDCSMGEDVCITFKNISAYEMNFTAEEIMERFKRGDESRHTEGSGLGLAIAKNLTELQDGQFEVVIDGDLFKVILHFK